MAVMRAAVALAAAALAVVAPVVMAVVVVVLLVQAMVMLEEAVTVAAEWTAMAAAAAAQAETRVAEKTRTRTALGPLSTPRQSRQRRVRRSLRMMLRSPCTLTDASARRARSLACKTQGTGPTAAAHRRHTLDTQLEWYSMWLQWPRRRR